MNVLGLFAKHWTPGAAKTRLAAELSAEQAAAVQREMLATLLGRFSAVADRRVVLYSPSDQRQAFARLAGDRWELEPQSGGDLGARMEAFFADAFAAAAQRVVVIGSDSPSLPVLSVQRAFALLANHEVVVGPSEDGGYYLLGGVMSSRACHDGPNVPIALPPNPKSKIQNPKSNILADMTWSTPDVLRTTIERLRMAGCRYAVLDTWYDVDTRSDLERLLAELDGTLDAELASLRGRLLAICSPPRPPHAAG